MTDAPAAFRSGSSPPVPWRVCRWRFAGGDLHDGSQGRQGVGRPVRSWRAAQVADTFVQVAFGQRPCRLSPAGRAGWARGPLGCRRRGCWETRLVPTARVHWTEWKPLPSASGSSLGALGSRGPWLGLRAGHPSTSGSDGEQRMEFGLLWCPPAGRLNGSLRY